MDRRADALVAASELVLALETAAAGDGNPATVGTVGTLRVEPGAVSVIPAVAVLGVEVRSTDAGALTSVSEAFAAACDRVEARRGVSIERRLVRGGDPVELDDGLVDAALAAAARHGAVAVRTYSGAGHDAQHIAARVPTALLFVPLTGGESHTPAEDARADDVALASEVAIDVLRGAL